MLIISVRRCPERTTSDGLRTVLCLPTRSAQSDRPYQEKDTRSFVDA